MSKPDLWMIAGPNGAGKTTFVQKMGGRLGLPQEAFINPDAITLQYLKAKGINTWGEAPPAVLKKTFIKAANDAQSTLEQRVDDGGLAVIETVLSTNKYCQLVDRVIELDGSFHLVYVALDSPERSKERVALRVTRGGHGVPEDKLVSRWNKSLEFLPWFAVRATDFWVFDNSSSEEHRGETLLVSGTERVLHLHGVPPPPMRVIVGDFITRFAQHDADHRWHLDLGEDFKL